MSSADTLHCYWLRVQDIANILQTLQSACQLKPPLESTWSQTKFQPASLCYPRTSALETTQTLQFFGHVFILMSTHWNMLPSENQLSSEPLFMHSALCDSQWCSRHNLGQWVQAVCVSGVWSLLVRQTREHIAKMQCERWAAGDAHWVTVFTWFFHKEQGMSREMKT